MKLYLKVTEHTQQPQHHFDVIGESDLAENETDLVKGRVVVLQAVSLVNNEVIPGNLAENI